MPGLGYQEYHHQLIARLAGIIKTTPPFNDESLAEAEAEFLKKLDSLLTNEQAAHDQIDTGQWLITTIVGRYPNITPMVPRPLFWYFGGDCLHFLGDEEIHYYQQLEEAFHDALAGSGEILDYPKLMHSLDSEGQSHLH